MVWETRPNGKRYFYLSKRHNGRIRKHYIGTGPLAELEAARIEQNRLDRLCWKQEYQQLLAQEAEADNLFRMANMAVTTALTAAGYHNTKYRGWRRSRMTTTDQTVDTTRSPEPQAAHPETPDMERFHQIVEAARHGDQAASNELLEIFKHYPQLAGKNGDMAARALWHWIHGIAGQDKHLHQAVLCELNQEKLLLAREGNGTMIEEKIIDQIMLTWLQLYLFEVKEMTEPAASLEYAKYRADRIERLSKRHLKSLELLAKIRAIKSDIVRVDNLVVNNTTVKQTRKKRRSSGTPVNRISKLVDGMDPVLQN